MRGMSDEKNILMEPRGIMMKTEDPKDWDCFQSCISSKPRGSNEMETWFTSSHNHDKEAMQIIEGVN